MEQGNNRVVSGKVRRNPLWLACYFPHCRGKLILAYVFLQALTPSNSEDLGLFLVRWEMTRVGKFCCVDIEAGDGGSVDVSSNPHHALLRSLKALQPVVWRENVVRVEGLGNS